MFLIFTLLAPPAQASWDLIGEKEYPYADKWRCDGLGTYRDLIALDEPVELGARYRFKVWTFVDDGPDPQETEALQLTLVCDNGREVLFTTTDHNGAGPGEAWGLSTHTWTSTRDAAEGCDTLRVKHAAYNSSLCTTPNSLRPIRVEVRKRTRCPVAEVCGDGVVNGAEQCDDGDGGNDGCAATCLLPICGDNLRDEGEDCDDGNALDGDGCSSLCEYEAPTCVIDGEVLPEAIFESVQGATWSGDPILESRSEPSVMLTDSAPVEGGFWSPGLGVYGADDEPVEGYAIFDFSACPLLNGDGDDVSVAEVTFAGSGYPLEEARVWAWDDLLFEWVELGVADNGSDGGSRPDTRTTLDLGSLAYTPFIRVADDTVISDPSVDYDGFDINVVQGLNGCDCAAPAWTHLEAEDASHDGVEVPRSHASGEVSVLLEPGQSLTFAGAMPPMCDAVEVNARYAIDGDASHAATLTFSTGAGDAWSVDATPQLTNGGHAWNLHFRTEDALLYGLDPAGDDLTLTLDSGWLVEIDQIALRCL